MHGIDAIARRARETQRPLAALFLVLVVSAPACAFELADVVPAVDGGNGGNGAGGGNDCNSAAIPVDPANLTVNPSFEDGASGWVGDQATLSLVEPADAPQGRFIVRVTNDAASGTDIESFIKDEPDTLVEAAVAGAIYRTTAWVRSMNEPPNPDATVNIILKSQQGDADIAESAEVALGPCFTKIEASGTTSHQGDTIGVHVAFRHQIPGEAFDVDMIQVVEELSGARAGGN